MNIQILEQRFDERENLTLSVGIVNHCRDTSVQGYRVKWIDLLKRLERPQERETKDGKAIIFAQFLKPYRCHQNVIAATAIALDIEQNKADKTHPPDPFKAAEILQHKGIESAVYSTFSHTPETPRYRVIIPINGTIPKDQVKPVFKIVAEQFPELSLWIDSACTEPARLFYLPAIKKGGHYEFYKVFGEVTQAADLVALVEHHKAQRTARQALRPRGISSGHSIIERFNQAFRLEQILEFHGYVKKGRSYLSPDSSSGIAGVKFFDNGKAYCFHNDILSEGGVIDSFQAFLYLDHGGNMEKAIHEAQQLLKGA